MLDVEPLQRGGGFQLQIQRQGDGRVEDSCLAVSRIRGIGVHRGLALEQATAGIFHDHREGIAAQPILHQGQVKGDVLVFRWMPAQARLNVITADSAKFIVVEKTIRLVAIALLVQKGYPQCEFFRKQGKILCQSEPQAAESRDL